MVFLDDRARDIITGMLAIVALILVAMLVSCAPKKVSVKPIVERPAYTYVETKPDLYTVWVKSGSDAKVKEELCTASYVCLIGEAGRVVTIERKRK